jgi:hypothetical protein
MLAKPLVHPGNITKPVSRVTTNIIPCPHSLPPGFYFANWVTLTIEYRFLVRFAPRREELALMSYVLSVKS